MIENDEHLRVAQEQIERLKHALRELRRTSIKAGLIAQAPAVIEHIRLSFGKASVPEIHRAAAAC